MTKEEMTAREESLFLNTFNVTGLSQNERKRLSLFKLSFKMNPRDSISIGRKVT